ncbi:hypothetical protein [Modestobacter sp. Leaf380]|uniref:hypothetical protein n=1 Tax=Modestobacter sp. Leaf380 TaxID=1736356 RepID=UPI0006FA6DEC|nr:hypothetical protein [Modestobacter sp. Leaf380]KQS73752.1 hypothetical protein ASG41_03955 [Modestobacter sp. Leaf380]
MRLSTVTKTALSASAALVLLTACGGGSDEEPAASSSSSAAATTTSPSAEQSSSDADPEASAFCSEAQAALGELESVANTADPTTIPALFADASAQLSAIEPPAEISESWGTLTGALAQVVTNIQGLDLTTPEGQQAFVTEFTTLQTTSTDAQAEVEAYVTTNCDITAAPTS